MNQLARNMWITQKITNHLIHLYTATVVKVYCTHDVKAETVRLPGLRQLAYSYYRKVNRVFLSGFIMINTI